MASAAINPKSGLYPRDIEIIKEQWTLIEKNYKVIVVDMFIEYFKKHPEGQALFKTLQGDPENLRNSPKMFAHASNVTYNISAMINTIEEPDVVLSILDRVSNNHIRHKVSPQNIRDMKKNFKCCLAKHMGSNLTKEAEAAWFRFFDLLFDTVEQHIEKSEKSSCN